MKTSGGVWMKVGLLGTSLSVAWSGTTGWAAPGAAAPVERLRRSVEVEAPPSAIRLPLSDTLDLSVIEPDRRFDFLLGHWRYAFPGGEGVASYHEARDGRTIVETVDGRLGDDLFTGVSLATYSDDGSWRRRWIDSLGNLLESTDRMGDYEHSAFAAMLGLFELDGVTFRHVWYGITAESFETDLQMSTDGGTTYRSVRRMRYARVDSPASPTGPDRPGEVSDRPIAGR